MHLLVASSILHFNATLMITFVKETSQSFRITRFGNSIIGAMWEKYCLKCTYGCNLLWGFSLKCVICHFISAERKLCYSAWSHLFIRVSLLQESRSWHEAEELVRRFCSLIEGSVKDLCSLLDLVSVDQPHQGLCCREASAQSLLCPCCCVPVAVSLSLCPCFAAHPGLDRTRPASPPQSCLMIWTCGWTPGMPWSGAVGDDPALRVLCSSGFHVKLSSSFCREQLVLTGPWEGEAQVFKKEGYKEGFLANLHKVTSFVPSLYPNPFSSSYSAKCLCCYPKYFYICPIYYLFLFLKYPSSSCGGTE